MKRFAYELYDVYLSIRENAQKLGCSEAALRKYLKKSTGVMSKIKERFTYFESVDEIYKANDEMLERSYRLLKEQGLLVVKTMDICHGNKQI